MKKLINNVDTSEKDMSKKDIIETIIFIINQILEYTSRLEQLTPSIFDAKKKQDQKGEEELSTDDQTLSDSFNDLNIKEDTKIEKYTLDQLIYYWVDKLNFDENLLLLMMMNLDKILDSKKIILNEENVANVLFTCMIITQKYYEDEKIFDKDYSRLKKIECDDLIEMQFKFLEMLNFSLAIDENDFKLYKIRMKKLWRKNMIYLCYS